MIIFPVPVEIAPPDYQSQLMPITLAPLELRSGNEGDTGNYHTHIYGLERYLLHRPCPPLRFSASSIEFRAAECIGLQ